MGLRGRIRRREAGTVDVREHDPVLDLRDTAPGKPLPCPACAAPGYLDRIDPRRGLQLSHCRACECRWQRSIEDLDAAAEITYLPPH